LTATITATKSLSRFRKIFSAIREAPKFPTVVLLVFLFCGVLGNHAIFGNLILPHDPNKTSFMDALSPPFWMEGGSAKYILGTDQLGRDLLSRIIAGAGVSLEIGIMVVFFAGLIGSLVAMTAGYIGGRIDMILMRLLDMVISMPFLVLAVTLAAIVGASKYNLIFIISALAWAWYARVHRCWLQQAQNYDSAHLPQHRQQLGRSDVPQSGGCNYRGSFTEFPRTGSAAARPRLGFDDLRGEKLHRTGLVALCLAWAGDFVYGSEL